MKTGLFIAVLVLLASTTVFGQGKERKDDRDGRPTQTITGDRPIIVRDNNKPGEVILDGGKPLVSGDEAKPIAIIRQETKPLKIVQEEIRPATIVRDGDRPTTLFQDKPKLVSNGRDDELSIDLENGHNTESHIKVKPVSTTVIRVSGDRDEVRDSDRDRVRDSDRDRVRDSDRDRVRNNDRDDGVLNVKPFKGNDDKPFKGNNDKPFKGNNDKPFKGTDDKPFNGNDDKIIDGVRRPVNGELVNGEKDRKPGMKIASVNTGRSSEKSVHVSGNIVLVKYRSSIVDSVQYDLDGSRLINGGHQGVTSRTSFAQDFLARGSRVTLYVSTSKTIDPKLAFAKFPIQREADHFPLSFDVDIELPDKQLGLLERADITLYFFVYINNPDTRIDTFLPAGTSQILLQGTNRLIQKLDVFVRANGIEISGLFRGRLGQRYIQSGTSFQVLIVSERVLEQKSISSSEAVAQLTINNVPAMFPVPFSLLVNHQTLKPNTKYYALAYVFENGVRRMIKQEPIWVINEQKILVNRLVVFSVVPAPFILKGVVTRSMPNSFFLQPRSTLILRLHEIGSQDRDIIFKLPEIVTLPQVFQVNISQAINFDPSKNYDIRALVTDEKNNIYMASLQPIRLHDELSKLIIPIDDLLYYVQVRLHSSSNQVLNYVPGSTAQVFVTESPETPTKPIVAMRIDSVNKDFRDFSIQVPATAIQRNRNYYLVMMVEINGIITHVSKTLLISNNQPPPLLIQLPVLSLNLVRGSIFDVENRPAQWSSSSYANLFLLDDKTSDPDKAIVQVWKIHLENDFPVRFEVQLDFSRLRADRVYRLQSAIENGRNLLEYKPAGSVLALSPKNGIMSDVRIPVRNVKTSQIVKGLIYIYDVTGPLPERSEIIVQLSSSPSLINPSIIDELRIKVDGRSLPVNFTMNLPLTKFDINSVYYFLVRYNVRDSVIIPVSQAFAFTPRNEATVVLTLSKTPQIPITGQVTSTGSPLILPAGSTLHLYITDNLNQKKPFIFSEVFLQATANSLYEFTMNIDSVILQKKVPLYLRADIIYKNSIILSIPRPALLQITPGGEWNINLVVDLPTLIVGQIVSMSQHEAINGEFDVFIQVLERGTTRIVHTARLRLDANLPQKFRIELDNELFIRYPALEIRALIKNCKEQTLYESGGSVKIRAGLNLQIDLPVVLTDRTKLSELQATVNEAASLYTGSWRLSVTGVVSDTKNGELNNFVLQK